LAFSDIIKAIISFSIGSELLAYGLRPGGTCFGKGENHHIRGKEFVRFRDKLGLGGDVWHYAVATRSPFIPFFLGAAIIVIVIIDGCHDILLLLVAYICHCEHLDTKNNNNRPTIQLTY
jgi:hypothetical protein